MPDIPPSTPPAGEPNAANVAHEGEFHLPREEIASDDIPPIPLTPTTYTPKTPPGPNNRQERWVPKFLGTLALQHHIGIACAAAGISRRSVERLKRVDPEFAELVDLARRDAEDRLAYSLWRRAHEGVKREKGVWGTRKNPKTGEVEPYLVATEVETRFSDAGAMFLLKAWNREVYSDRRRVEHSRKDTLRDLVIAMARDRGIDPDVALKQMEAYLKRLREQQQMGLLPAAVAGEGGE